jgi:excisionase family DNA binding protein
MAEQQSEERKARRAFGGDTAELEAILTAPTLTVGQITRIAGCSEPRTVRRLLEAGGIRVLKVGRRYTVERLALERQMPDFYQALLRRAVTGHG